MCWRLTEREVLGRYRGSLLGIGWSLANPLAMLTVYTFVFSQVFKARWGGPSESGPLGYAINLFAGLIVFNLFSECATRSTGLVIANPNYVKKVVFPLEILGPVTVGSATFHAIISLIALLIVNLLVKRETNLSILWLPIVWIPLLLGSLTVTWTLSALGVFIRDIGQIVGLSLSMLLFVSPIFFPISALPTAWQQALNLNPLAAVIEQTRTVVVQGSNPSWTYLVAGITITAATSELSYRLFLKLKKGFADVL